MFDKVLEEKIVDKFFIKSKRKRIKEFLSNPKRRRDFTFSLSHCRDLEFDKFRVVEGPNEDEKVKEYISLLKNTKNCYVISEDEKLDGKRLEIDIALTETIGYPNGTLLVFGDGEIVYYEGESPNDRWISKF